MSSFEYKSISPAEFHVYEARAHQLRADATQDGVRAVRSYLKSSIVGLVNLVRSVRHA